MMYFSPKEVVSSSVFGRSKQLIFSQNSLLRLSNNINFDFKIKLEIQKNCKLLGIPVEYTVDQLKEAYIKLAKKYHPDSGSTTANAEKFSQILVAYKSLLAGINEKDDSNEIVEKNFGIRHTAPQHRQYLSYEGVGYGPPAQRQKQYQQHKVIKASERVHNYRTDKLMSEKKDAMILKDVTLAWQFKTRQAMDRLVEDLIQESMQRGDFDNLPGMGKPLKKETPNPYVDAMTHKLNEILIENGFTPAWIVYEREIREETDKIRLKLFEARRRFGKIPLSDDESSQWLSAVSKFKDDVQALNNKINHFNMIVPAMRKQKLHFNLYKEADKILESGDSSDIPRKESPVQNKQSSSLNKDDTFFGMLFKIFS